MSGLVLKRLDNGLVSVLAKQTGNNPENMASKDLPGLANDVQLPRRIELFNVSQIRQLHGSAIDLIANRSASGQPG